MVDELDSKLIHLLREDGRQTYKALAEQLGISNVTVQNRLKKLLKDEIIAITVFVDPTKIGAPIGVLICLDVEQKELELVFTNLSLQPSIDRISITSGRFNMIARASFNSFDKLTQFRISTLATMDGIKTIEIFVLMQLEQRGEVKLKPLTAVDQELITLLRENGRQTSTALSQRLKVSESTVQRKIEQLIREDRIRISALIADGKVDWHWRGAIGIRVRNKYLMSVFNKLTVHPAINFAAYTSGRFDIITSVTTDSREKLYEIVEQEISNYEGVVAGELFISERGKFGPQLKADKSRLGK